MQHTNATYDVIIVGSGIGGSILAAHIAGGGLNPANGERLKVAMLEAGPYWRGEPRPGHGVPVRRRMITNFISDSPPHLWPWGMMKIVGGTAVHAGGSVYLPYDVDYKHWVEGGTDWTAENCRAAGEEVARVFNIHTEPDEVLTRGNMMFREAARALGREVHAAQVARRNCLYCGFCEGGYFCRYDSRMTPLTTYMPLAERRGVEIIPEATVERVIIEKKGARPVAAGVVFRRGGRVTELRARKVIVSAGVVGTPLLLSRSGYGAKEDAAGALVVENRNVGRHLDIHAAVVVSAYFDEPVKDGARGAAPAGFFFLDDAGPDGYGRMRIKDSGMNGIEEPWMLANSSFAPDFGRAHKEFMRRGRTHRGGI
ncbi:MAG: GMC family oxidoreductase N-terminal domain-containing protein, partial [Pyrinomonadaceae bacterium]